jgi:hypothetical protein
MLYLYTCTTAIPLVPFGRVLQVPVVPFSVHVYVPLVPFARAVCAIRYVVRGSHLRLVPVWRSPLALEQLPMAPPLVPLVPLTPTRQQHCTRRVLVVYSSCTRRVLVYSSCTRRALVACTNIETIGTHVRTRSKCIAMATTQQRLLFKGRALTRGSLCKVRWLLPATCQFSCPSWPMRRARHHCCCSTRSRSCRRTPRRSRC